MEEQAVSAQTRIGVREAFGLDPLPQRLREIKLTMLGDATVPRARFDWTSLKLFTPALSIRTWLGLRRPDGLVPIANLFNRTQTPIAEGWSVRVTQVRDFRGGDHTYDSHNGTDLVVPVGTVVRAPAAGRVVRVSSEFNRGGLKVFVDHGRGLVTSSNHLARALVRPGDRLERGEPMALAGYSGIDGLLTFPWVAPHIHFNVWLNGELVDPFAAPGEVPVWRGENEPVPNAGASSAAEYEPADWDEAAVSDAVSACRDPAVRQALSAREPFELRAADVLFQLSYYPTRFERRPRLYRKEHPREPWLDLPLGQEFRGVIIPEEPRLKR